LLSCIKKTNGKEEVQREELWRNIQWPETVTEIHVHLGGSVPLYRLWEIGVERGIRGLGKGYEQFIGMLRIDGNQVNSLDSYLGFYDRIELIQSGPDAVRESIIIAIHRAYRTGGMTHIGPGGEGGDPNPLFRVGRLELRLNPLKRTGAVFLKGQHAGLYDVDRVIKAACTAVEEVEIAFKGKIQAGLIFCFGRDMTFEANMILAHKTRSWLEKTDKIIGIDLAGPESANPLSTPQALEEMLTVFDTVGTKIPRTLHAGETEHVDIETFIRTVEALSPQRIAHPVSALRAYWEKRDQRGLRLLQERNIVCELCVKSNLLTKAVKDMAEYARIIQTLDEFGIKYTFSTDAPSLQLTSLAQELILLLNHKAASEEQILRSLKAAEEHSFLPSLPGVSQTSAASLQAKTSP